MLLLMLLLYSKSRWGQRRDDDDDNDEISFQIIHVPLSHYIHLSFPNPTSTNFLVHHHSSYLIR